MKILITVALISSILFSCTTAKHIVTTVVKVDSTAIHERDSVIEVKKLDSAAYTNLIASLSENNIIFQDTGSTRIEYYPDGSIKVVEGKLKSISAKYAHSQQGAAYWRSAYDSLAAHKSKDSIQVKTDVKIVDRIVKRTFIPWWMFVLLVVALGIGYFIKSKIIKL